MIIFYSLKNISVYVYAYINDLNEVTPFGLIMSQGQMLSKKTLVPGSEAFLGAVDQGSSGDFKHNGSSFCPLLS